MADSSWSDHRENERELVLPFECLRTFPEGVSEVRLWWDKYLQVERVGKRVDISGISHDGSLPEPATLQSINHPNVAPILAVAHIPEFRPPMHVIELISPYYKRGSITDALLRGETFTQTQAVAIAQKMLLGLAELHEVKGILHRDVKSGNVLLSDDNTLAKVADLGIAARLDAAGGAATANNPTLYAPPEFSSGRLTVSSDIFSAGLVVAELIRGMFPYAEYSMASNIERLASGLPAIRSEHLALPIEVHRTLQRVVAKAVSPVPAKRYQSAMEFCSALAKAPVLDWVKTDELRWEAPFRHNPDKRVSIVGSRKRDGSYEFVTRTRARFTWRKAGSPESFPSAESPERRRMFDMATELASKH